MTDDAAKKDERSGGRFRRRVQKEPMHVQIIAEQGIVSCSRKSSFPYVQGDMGARGRMSTRIDHHVCGNRLKSIFAHSHYRRYLKRNWKRNQKIHSHEEEEEFSQIEHVELSRKSCIQNIMILARISQIELCCIMPMVSCMILACHGA